MIINADSLLPHLKAKVRPPQSDRSRHILCPDCKKRTKLNTLGDGRKKCTVCGKKFRINKATDANKLQQCAEILLCFCLDFSQLRTAQITHHRYRLVSVYYDHFRKLLAAHDGALVGDRQVFGVRLGKDGIVSIDPLKNEEIKNDSDTYAGFISNGKFKRVAHDEQTKEEAEHLWNWIRERVRTHHGIWKRNTGFYLKELEWKYNNRDLHPHLQARKIIDVLPMNFIADLSSTPEAPRERAQTIT